jgi:pSer/pThr/pTyr-binding forkhead associated (FHA) protein
VCYVYRIPSALDAEEATMRKDQDEILDPRQPYLVVVYGATKRKHKPLRGHIVLVGRSASCDIGLVSPEVASVHCVLIRLPDGWYIRDCSNRATRINGRTIHEERLKDGDVVQVGAFSFEVRLPPGSQSLPEPSALPGQVEHLQQSRRRLASRALRLRKRLREQTQTQAEVAQREADLDQMEHRLRTMHRDAQAKRQDRDQLEQQREQIAREREALELQQQELLRQQLDLERLRAETDGQAQPEGLSSRETWLDTRPSKQLESARRLLRELAERRKAAAARAGANEPGA